MAGGEKEEREGGGWREREKRVGERGGREKQGFSDEEKKLRESVASRPALKEMQITKQKKAGVATLTDFRITRDKKGHYIIT